MFAIGACSVLKVVLLIGDDLCIIKLLYNQSYIMSLHFILMLTLAVSLGMNHIMRKLCKNKVAVKLCSN